MEKQLVDKLYEPLPQEALKQHPSKSFLSVIDPMAVIQRLNDVFGVGGWNFETEYIDVREVTSGRSTQWMSAVKGRLTADAFSIRIEQFGGSSNSDMGDALKGGATDALTKCASYLGVGYDVYAGKQDHNGFKTPQAKPAQGKRPYPDPDEVKGLPFEEED